MIVRMAPCHFHEPGLAIRRGQPHVAFCAAAMRSPAAGSMQNLFDDLRALRRGQGHVRGVQLDHQPGGDTALPQRSRPCSKRRPTTRQGTGALERREGLRLAQRNLCDRLIAAQAEDAGTFDESTRPFNPAAAFVAQLLSAVQPPEHAPRAADAPRWPRRRSSSSASGQE